MQDATFFYYFVDMHVRVYTFHLFVYFSIPYLVALIFFMLYLVYYREAKQDTEVGPEAKEEAKL